MYIATLEAIEVANMAIYPSEVIQLATLQWDKAFTKILTKYTDYADVFLFDLVVDLSENISINKYAILLIEGKQLPYGPIYALKLVELKTLKIYI